MVGQNAPGRSKYLYCSRPWDWREVFLYTAHHVALAVQATRSLLKRQVDKLVNNTFDSAAKEDGRALVL